MYKRFLNNGDYYGLVTEEALQQLIRNNEDRLQMAEEAAEASIVEYLIDNYMIEEELAVGKRIAEYNFQITYPTGSYFYHDGKIYKAIRTINGCKAPSTRMYWQEYTEAVDESSTKTYSQFTSYEPGDMVYFSNTCYICLVHNGPDYGNIRIPGIFGWKEVPASAWMANVEYDLWDVVKYESRFYALLDASDVDLTINPYESDNWGLIGDYICDYKYQCTANEYVVYEGKVFIPEMEVNADELEVNYNIVAHDPRNPNVKKHLLRLAVYELHKLISPNNISSTRVKDCEMTIAWLKDANRLKINPQIPRRVGDDNKEVTDYAIATFARDYDPNHNPWQI